MTSAVIIGSGRMAAALGHSLQAAGYEVRAIQGRHPQHRQQLARALGVAAFPIGTPCAAELWIIAVTDAAIPQVAHNLHDILPDDALVLHTSGLHNANLLRSAGILNPCASMHPLAAITAAPPATLAQRFHGVYFAIEGDPDACVAAGQLAIACGAFPVSLKAEQKGHYHAGAALLANHLVTLFAAAEQLFAKANIEPALGHAMLHHLAQGALDNLSQHSRTCDALTGPVRRGDIATLDAHFRAMEEVPDAARLYRAALPLAMDLAADAGLAPREVAAMVHAARRWKRNEH